MTTISNDEYEVRKQKLDQIRAADQNPYPDRYTRTHTAEQALALPDGTADVRVAGRLLTTRQMGKIIFAHLQDATGRIQLVVKADNVGQHDFAWFHKLLDAGDFIGASGEMFTTQRGERSLLVSNYQLLSKTLRPLPEKFHGLKDQEAQYRQRYLDLVSNRQTYERFLFRSQLIKLLRQFYWDHGFTELETPVLTNTPSGALARPFVTHHNALDLDVYLRIAPEVFLKEAMVGGFEKVFEIARCFRNEGIDPSHLQDFTMLEHYAAYWNFADNMVFTQDLFTYLLTELFGKLTVPIKNRSGELVEIDFTPPWPVRSFRDVILDACGIDIESCPTAADLRNAITEKMIAVEGAALLERGNLIDALYKTVARDQIIQPTFLTQHPIDLSPLARRNDNQPNVADRFQLVANGWELLNAYSELVDPIDQRQRFDQQSAARTQGDAEAHVKDDEFVLALEHGAPPMSGWGMGIDRLVTLLTQQDNLRDTVLFPLLRPER